MKKKEKEKKIVQDKDFIRYKAFYQECDVIEIKSGEFIKMYEISELDNCDSWAAYNNSLRWLINSPDNLLTYQFFNYKDRKFILFRVKADVVDDALEMFDNIISSYTISNENFDFRAVGLHDWFNILHNLTQFKDLDKELVLTERKQKTLKQYIQPYNRHTKPLFVEFEQSQIVTRTLIIFNYPSEVFNGLLSEILSISDRIYSSLYLKKVDCEACLGGLDLIKDMEPNKKVILKSYLEDSLSFGIPLYHTCSLLSVSGTEIEVERIVNKIEDLASKYFVSINNLEYQQNCAYLSTLPLCDNLINCNKVLSDDSVIGLLAFSWINKLHCGVRYGVSELSGCPVLFNRMIEKNSGFYLGSDVKQISQAIQKEIKELHQYNPNLKFAVFTMDDCSNCCPLENTKILCDDLKLNREILKAMVYLTCGTNGRVSTRISNILNDVLEKDINNKSIDDFLNAIMGTDSSLGGELEQKINANLKSGMEMCVNKQYLQIYKALSGTYYERLLKTMGGIVNCDADIIYILCADEIAKLNDNYFLMELFKNRDKVYNLSGKNNVMIYKNKIVKELLQKSDFKYVLQCGSLDRVNLTAILGLSKEQKLHIMGRGSLLITKYVDYMLVDDGGDRE